MELRSTFVIVRLSLVLGGLQCFNWLNAAIYLNIFVTEASTYHSNVSNFWPPCVNRCSLIFGKLCQVH